jgi:multidrug transporter EmrE-like cation transporter
MSANARSKTTALVFLSVSILLLIAAAALGKQAALDTAGRPLSALAVNPWYAGVLACLALHALVWPQVLRVFPLSVAYSIANPASMAGILIVANAVFGEPIRTANAIGAAVMALGLWLLLTPGRAVAAPAGEAAP